MLASHSTAQSVPGILCKQKSSNSVGTSTGATGSDLIQAHGCSHPDVLNRLIHYETQFAQLAKSLSDIHELLRVELVKRDNRILDLENHLWGFKRCEKGLPSNVASNGMVDISAHDAGVSPSTKLLPRHCTPTHEATVAAQRVLVETSERCMEEDGIHHIVDEAAKRTRSEFLTPPPVTTLQPATTSPLTPRQAGGIRPVPLQFSSTESFPQLHTTSPAQAPLTLTTQQFVPLSPFFGQSQRQVLPPTTAEGVKQPQVKTVEANVEAPRKTIVPPLFPRSTPFPASVVSPQAPVTLSTSLSPTVAPFRRPAMPNTVSPQVQVPHLETLEVKMAVQRKPIAPPPLFPTSTTFAAPGASHQAPAVTSTSQFVSRSPTVPSCRSPLVPSQASHVIEDPHSKTFDAKMLAVKKPIGTPPISLRSPVNVAPTAYSERAVITTPFPLHPTPQPISNHPIAPWLTAEAASSHTQMHSWQNSVDSGVCQTPNPQFVHSSGYHSVYQQSPPIDCGRQAETKKNSTLLGQLFGWMNR